MLSAKDEQNAIGATLFFNFAHYALRPWPWIITAFASLVCYPQISDLREAFPHVDHSILAHDIAYPAMVSRLGPGLIGIVIASITASYMSTIGTHLNWGASYAVNDFYKRFVHPSASEKQLVFMARLCTLGLLVLAGLLSLFLTSATQAFNILLLSGAGSGAIYLLRWFWWRINAWSEIFAMTVSAIVALVLVLAVPDESLAFGAIDGAAAKFLIAVVATTIAWLVGTFLTPPDSPETLRRFYSLCRPGGPGWARVVKQAAADGVALEDDNGRAWQMPRQVACIFIGCVAVYAVLFAIGSTLYGQLLLAAILYGVAILSTVFLFRVFRAVQLAEQADA